jgi:predicted RNase H-like HicB family nuclease
MNLEYTVQIWQEGTQFVAHAMPLDVMSAGATPQDARSALYEAVDLFLQTAADVGTLDDVLEECGYSRNRGSWVSPAWVSVERHATRLVA